eukprot:CAMPEP_0179111322 /NCGR_PEP_ID=MMETSP0796-20121207/51991_1 /TAXON_ID=73915 /ORGANISM="Pyrodinium bahamense, Strain pbaha01" /LENGTH=126 /DNA_ID=CAMNT_0020809471 /DNA_START=341 /DNA_END=722 /DNA_ORIENTATION=-
MPNSEMQTVRSKQAHAGRLQWMKLISLDGTAALKRPGIANLVANENLRKSVDGDVVSLQPADACNISLSSLLLRSRPNELDNVPKLRDIHGPGFCGGILNCNFASPASVLSAKRRKTVKSRPCNLG